MIAKRIQLILLLVVFFLGFLVRLYRFNNPVADWHSWRQVDTSAVSWHFVHQGFDVLHPMYFDISNVQSGFDNPHGYRYVEFPLYNIAQAGLSLLFPVLSLEEWGRLISIVMFLVGSLFPFLLVRRRSNKKIALLTLLFAIFLPYNIYYSRTILPDTSMVTMLLGSMYFLDKWLDGFRKKTTKKNFMYLFLSLLFIACSLLLKPYAIFYGFAMVGLIWEVFGWKFIKRWELWIFLVLAIVPLVWWRKYMLSYPEGIPVNKWLFNGNGIRFRPSFFRWIFYERLTKLIGGYINALFLGLGIWEMVRHFKHYIFFTTFILSACIYICVIATGNVQHDYYQIVIMPAVALLMGMGAYWLASKIIKVKSVSVAYAVVGICMLAGFVLSWNQVKDYFNINNIAVVHAGEAVERLTPIDAKVVAPYDGDTTLLYYTKRKGWPSFEHSLDQLIHMGAGYLILVNPQPGDYAISKQYKMIASSKEYVLFDLHKKL